MRFIILSIGLLLAFAPLRAQRQLDLKECREMALEYSKQLAIAEKQKEKAVWTKKEYGANYLPKLSASGFYLYHQKEYPRVAQNVFRNGQSSDANNHAKSKCPP